MKRSTILTAAAILGAGILGLCGSVQSAAPAAPAKPTAPAATAAPAAPAAPAVPAASVVPAAPSAPRAPLEDHGLCEMSSSLCPAGGRSGQQAQDRCHLPGVSRRHASPGNTSGVHSFPSVRTATRTSRTSSWKTAAAVTPIPHQPLNIVFSGNVKAACNTCHPEQVAEIDANHSAHSKVDCSFCHDKHGYKPDCLNCHKSMPKTRNTRTASSAIRCITRCSSPTARKCPTTTAVPATRRCATPWKLGQPSTPPSCASSATPTSTAMCPSARVCHEAPHNAQMLEQIQGLQRLSPKRAQPAEITR